MEAGAIASGMLRSDGNSVGPVQRLFLECCASPDSIPRNHSPIRTTTSPSIHRCWSGRYFGHVLEVRTSCGHQVDCAIDSDAFWRRSEEPCSRGIGKKLMRVFALSDIHVDYDENARWIANLSLTEYQDD